VDDHPGVVASGATSESPSSRVPPAFEPILSIPAVSTVPVKMLLCVGLTVHVPPAHEKPPKIDRFELIVISPTAKFPHAYTRGLNVALEMACCNVA
jgi:hypothetical protein